jgi:acyl-CoA dehydrogenase
VPKLAVRHEASRCLTYHALRLFAGGSDALRAVTAAKLLSQRAAFEVAEAAFRMLDGDAEMGRAMRDTVSARSAAAPTRMREILGRQLGLQGVSAPAREPDHHDARP